MSDSEVKPEETPSQESEIYNQTTQAEVAEKKEKVIGSKGLVVLFLILPVFYLLFVRFLPNEIQYRVTHHHEGLFHKAVKESEANPDVKVAYGLKEFMATDTAIFRYQWISKLFGVALLGLIVSFMGKLSFAFGKDKEVVFPTLIPKFTKHNMLWMFGVLGAAGVLGASLLLIPATRPFAVGLNNRGDAAVPVVANGPILLKQAPLVDFYRDPAHIKKQAINYRLYPAADSHAVELKRFYAKPENQGSKIWFLAGDPVSKEWASHEQANAQVYKEPQYMTHELLLYAVAGPAFEEFLFTGLMFLILCHWVGPRWAFGMVVLLFAYLHPASLSFSFATFTTLVCSSVSILLFVKTGSLLPAILWHGGGNFFIFFCNWAFIMSQSAKGPGDPFYEWQSFLSLI